MSKRSCHQIYSAPLDYASVRFWLLADVLASAERRLLCGVKQTYSHRVLPERFPCGYLSTPRVIYSQHEDKLSRPLTNYGIEMPSCVSVAISILPVCLSPLAFWYFVIEALVSGPRTPSISPPKYPSLIKAA